MNNEEEKKVPCPYCLKEISIKARFCKYCGKPLKKCPSCGDINTADSVFCRTCGSKLPEMEIEKPPEPIKQPIEQITPTVPPPIYNAYTISPPYVYTYGDYIRKPPEGYQPKTLIHPYSRIRGVGFLGGPIPTSNVLATSFEAIGLSLAYIAVGTTIASIFLAMGMSIVVILIASLIAAPFILSAPFFGIYYVSSKWLYKIFAVQRPIGTKTILANYFFGTLLLTLFSLILSPLFYLADIFSFVTFTTIPIALILVILTIVPIKALLADMVYIKAALDEKERIKSQEEGNNNHQSDIGIDEKQENT